MYFVYLLQSVSDEKKTYIGCTQGVSRRLEQHNGIRSGGARRTRIHRPWRVVCFVSGFESKEDALRFEYMWSHLGNLQNLTPRRRRLAAQFTVLSRILYSEDFIGCDYPVVFINPTDIPIFRSTPFGRHYGDVRICAGIEMF